MAMKKELIRLGSTNPELRPHIRAILSSFARSKGEGYVAIHSGLNKLEEFNQELVAQSGSVIRPNPVVDALGHTVHVYDSRSGFDASLAKELAREHGITLVVDPDVGPWGHPNDADRYILSRIKRSKMDRTVGLSPQQILKDWRKLQNYVDNYGYELTYDIETGKYAGGYMELEQRGQNRNGWFNIEFRLFSPEGKMIEKDKVPDFVSLGDIMDYLSR